jgi:hypothetical protein
MEGIIAQRSIKLRRAGRELIGPCPECGGEDRFSINVTKQVFNCRGCGASGDVIALAMLLDHVDFAHACEALTGEPPPKPNGKQRTDRKGPARSVVAESYRYRDQGGKLSFVVERVEYQNPDGSFVLKGGKRKKSFRQKRPDPAGQNWIYNTDGCPALLYRLPEAIEAVAQGRVIFIVEGERKADLLASWGCVGTCNVGGALKWTTEHSAFLQNADVVLVPDNDDRGWQHTNTVGASLTGIAKRIRVLLLPDLKPKGDILDWAKAGGAREQLDALVEQTKDWQPPPETAHQTDDEKAEAKKREDELIEGLLNARQGLEFHRLRDEAAKELKLPKGALDAELQVRRDTVPLHGHWHVVPADEPVEGDSLLRDIIRRLRRHVVCSHDDALVIALWVMFSWVHDDVAVHSPILLITSAEPESGKTTTLGLISYLAPRALATVEISQAALFRSIQLWQPSFIIDEFDTVLAAKDDDKAELRSVINSGHTKGQGVVRCIPPDYRPELFSTFAAKAIGMVGRKLPVPTLTRCIIIELRRCAKGEKIDPFAHRDDSELGDLRRRLRRWSMDNTDVLRDVKVAMPDQFRNRRSDNWRVLLAIADLCSGAEDWGDKARFAAVKLEGASDVTSIGVRLLADIKRVFEAGGCDAILSATLVTNLKEDEEAPWSDWNHGKGLTQNSLAVLLGGGGGRGRGSRGGFGIRSCDVHLPGDIHGKGYKRGQFEEAWARYLPDDAPSSPQEGE